MVMGLDPGPDLEVTGRQASAAPVSEGGRVQVGDRETGASNAPRPRQAPVSVADELIKLAQLRDAGVLTPEEFQAQKAKLLG